MDEVILGLIFPQKGLRFTIASKITKQEVFMKTKAQKLKNGIVRTEQGIYKTWLAVPTRVILVLLLLFAIQHVGSVSAADNQETQMGEALMQMMEEGEVGALAAPARTASENWRVCTVKRVGPGWGNVYVRLVCNGVPENWFIAKKDQERDILAAGLTAISLKAKVDAFLAHMPSGYHEIRALYVRQ